MKIIVTILLLSFGLIQTAYCDLGISLTPYPNHLKKTGESLKFKSFTIKGPSSLIEETNFLKTKLKTLGLPTSAKGTQVVFILKNKLAKEAYELNIGKNQIEIFYGQPTGAFYAIQTLIQLIDQNLNHKVLPGLSIEDEPAFGWRAMMLDDCRYFKGKEVVKQLLAQMAALKMNVFHWHLTDDQGWRIEIKKYPRLTEIGGFRKNSQLGNYESEVYEDKKHGGFYTQSEIKEIVAFAAKRHILVVPEIEMPGHASAAIAAYPWLGMKNEIIEVPGKFGVHYEVYNVANPKVVNFFKDVLTEVMQLFPGNVIHIGGDEVKFNQWEASEDIKAYMTKNGLKTFPDVQVAFTNHMSSFLEGKGKKMMGWNEIMGSNVHEWQKDVNASGKLSKNAIVHFWKGDAKLIKEAVEKGYKVVNSTHSFTYLDYDYKSISLEKAYMFNPVTEGIADKDKGNIIGLGCQMWAEWIPTVDAMYKQIFPRAAAYAETGWTNHENKNFTRFQSSLEEQKLRWKKAGIPFHE